MTAEPDWNLLPGDPMAFFGLEPGFDRSDLKRAYNPLLRRFRPEQFPAEFQRLRSAYEQLEEALRYGQELPAWTPPTLQPAADRAEEPSQATPDSAEAGASRGLDLAALLASGGAAAVLAQLEQSDALPPHHWLLRVQLREACPRGDHDLMPMALLPALQAMSGHPGAQGLWRALRELDVRQVPLGTLADFLEAAADLIRKGRYPGGLYYYATAPLWQELFRRGKAQAVATRLKRARAMVGPREEGFAIMLLLELVRSNVLRADEAWIEASLAELSQVHHALPDWVDAELELVERLLHYRRLLPEFLNGNALRERMHECIVAMAEGPPGEARLRFLRLMNEFVDDPAALQEAVPPRAPGEAEGLASMLLVGMGSELSEGEVQPIAQSGGLDRLAPFLYRLQNETSRTRLGAVEDILGRVLGFGLVIGLVVVMATIAESLPSRWSIPIIVVGVLGAWKLAGRPFGLLARAFLPRLYRKVWRERAFEFLAASRMGYYELLDSLLHIEGDELTEQHRLYVGASEDSALPLYSMALRFAR